jgi:hypothetical protein
MMSMLTPIRSEVDHAKTSLFCQGMPTAPSLLRARDLFQERLFCLTLWGLVLLFLSHNQFR